MDPLIALALLTQIMRRFKNSSSGRAVTNFGRVMNVPKLHLTTDVRV